MTLLTMAPKLTKRQKEIGLCLLVGMSTKDIAHQLNISIHTLREHQSDIRKKLACQNAYQTGYKLAMLLEAEPLKLCGFYLSVEEMMLKQDLK